MQKTAVVILNWNGWQMLRQFLPLVMRYNSTRATLYVADNASTDRSADEVRRHFPTVHVIQLNQNYGFAEGYNRALRHVDATYAVLLNSDVEVTPNWLEPLINHLDQHPEVAACQPKVCSWHQRDHFEYAGASGGFIDRYGYPFCRGRIMNHVEKDEGQYDDTIPVFWATGAALCIRMDDYKKAGGLDGRFFAHMEEIDLCWRLKARGRQVTCVPASTVFHVGGATLQKDSPQKTFLNFRNNLLMLYKNLPQAELKRVMRIRTLLDYAAALVFLLKGETAHAQAVVRARKAFTQLRASFAAARLQNLELCTHPDTTGRYPKSIIVASFLRGIKKFSQIARDIPSRVVIEKNKLSTDFTHNSE